MKSCGSQASTPSSSREVWNLKISIYYWLIDDNLRICNGDAICEEEENKVTEEITEMLWKVLQIKSIF